MSADGIDRLDSEVMEINDKISEIKGKLIEHEVRFSNGREVMAEIKTDLAELKPKTPDWMKLLGAALGVLAMILGAHYWLLEKLNDRPTGLQLEKAFHEHSVQGHTDTQRDIIGIRDMQISQGVSLDVLKQTVAQQGTKLDTILRRLPNRDR